ncbi:MAG: Ig-like domain-containing protein [Archaeoglobaceae archaeon]
MKNMALLFVILLMLILISPVASHRVHTSWEMDTIELKAWYGGGDPMADADVKVFINQSGEQVVYEQGVTDENGTFTFSPKTGVSNYTAEIGSTGHEGQLEINLASSSSSGEDQELPLYMRIGAGFGYLLGLAGAALAYTGWKKNKGK